MSAQPLGVVIDTNVWISGLLTRVGPPGQVTRQVVRTRQPVFSTQTFEELEQRLWRPRFDRYISLEQRKELLADIESVASWVVVSPAIAAQKFCRDPTDDKFIHAALATEPAWLVTGDKDLLVLADSLSPLGVRILSPVEALVLCADSPQS